MEILDGEKIFTWTKIALQLIISFLFWISDNFSGIHGGWIQNQSVAQL